MVTKTFIPGIRHVTLAGPQGLELMQRDPANPLVAAALRRERVWERIERRIADEHPARVNGLEAARQRAEQDAAALKVLITTSSGLISIESRKVAENQNGW